MMETKQAAEVIYEVENYGDTDEPVIRLANGQEVKPIWCDRYIRLGTKGTAEYVPDRNAWKFIPDE